MSDPPAYRCQKLGKVRYPTWKAATLRLIAIRQGGVALYTVHGCQFCQGYHLTTHNRSDGYQRKVPNGNARRSKKNRR